MKRLASVAVCLGALIACGGGGGGSDAGTTNDDAGTPALEPKLSSIQANIFPTCASSACHAPPTLAGAIDLSLGKSYETLVGANGQGAPIPDKANPGELAAADAGYLLVDPGNPAKSFLLLKVTTPLDPKYGAQMPNGGLPPLSTAQVNAIADWIDAGAPND